MKLENIKYLDIESVKSELKKKIETYKSYLDAWQTVTYNTKKDGDNFANLKKNFNNLYFEKGGYIFISTNGEKDYISIKTYLNDYKKDEKEKLLKNHTVFGYDLSVNISYAVHNIEEIKQDIKIRVQVLKDGVDKMINAYNNILNNDFIKILLSLKEKLNNSMSDEDDIINRILKNLDN